MQPDWMYSSPVTRSADGQLGTNKTTIEASKRLSETYQNTPKATFDQILHTQIVMSRVQHSVLNQGALQFSKHAQDRLRLRDIRLSPDQLSRIQKGIEEVAQKGGKDSLVICGDISFVVNVPNRTVVTALDINQSSNHVFTQIDSAVIV
jgi:flagellar operon protein